MAANFRSVVKGFIKNSADASRIQHVGGGWENWLKGQLALVKQEEGAKIRCEIGVYENGQRADLIMRAEKLEKKIHWNHVELKCLKRWELEFGSEKWAYETLNEFFSYRRFGGDVTKIHDNNILDKFKGDSSIKSAIGLMSLEDVVANATKNGKEITTMEEAVQYLKNIYNVDKDNSFRYGEPKDKEGLCTVGVELCGNDVIMVYSDVTDTKKLVL